MTALTRLISHPLLPAPLLRQEEERNKAIGLHPSPPNLNQSRVTNGVKGRAQTSCAPEAYVFTPL